MAEEEKADKGCEEAEVTSLVSAGMQPGPEIDQAGAARLVQKAAQNALLPNVDEIMLKLAEKAKAGHEPSVKMLFDLTLKQLADGVFAKITPSFAAELWEISERLLGEVEK